MDRTSPRRILALALPALPVLAAEPAYLLVDTAVVGHLGGVALGGLAVGALVLTQLAVQLTFLSYGTTARASRLHGAGRRDEAVNEGVQATWLALGIGFALLIIGQVFARPVAELFAGPEVADAAVSWLRVALFGAPMILVTLAGNGWMRAVQDTRRPLRYVLAGNGISAVLCPLLVYTADWGLTGSAAANVVAQTISGGLFLRALVKERAPLRARPSVMRAQVVMGRDLVLRSLAFQACFVSALAVAGHTSVAAVGAHQIVLQLWTFVALVLDSLAIAAQSLVGAALGAGRDRQAKALANQLTRYGLVFGVALGILFAAVTAVLPSVFTSDTGVLAEIPHAWWFFVALQPIAGVVFALDGVLLGAGDAGYLRTSTLIAAVAGFLPLVWLSLAFDWGLVGIWTGLSAFMVIRFGAVLTRARGDAWAVVGAVRA